MGRYSGGYTIIEVMIVVAVTGILFASAILVFQGQQGSTEFSQAMQDLSSQVQSYASQVSAGNYDGSDGYNCSVSAAGQPQLSVASGSSGDNSGCIFLGRAIQITPGKGTMEAYAVVGSRDSFNCNNSDCYTAATSLDVANPTVAMTGGSCFLNVCRSGVYVLEGSYTLENGAVFTHSRDSSHNEYDLMGIYTNLQASASSNGNTANNLLMIPYACNPGSGAGCAVNSTQVANCVKGSATCSGGTPLSSWEVCIQAANGQTGQLTVNNTSTGITTQLDSDSCP